MTSIEFEGLVFDDQALSGFTISSWSGWWDAAPMRVSVNDRPQADGAFGASNNWRGARTISVEGSWSGASMVEAYAAMQALAAIQPYGVPSPFRVLEPFSTKTAVVALANGPTLPQELFQPFFKWSFDVVAYDPLKYGDPVSSSTGVPVSGGGLLFPLGTTPTAFWDFGADGVSGRVSVSNPGTAAVWPTLTASGGLGAGFVVTNVTTGQSIRFERPIPEGSVVTINQRTGRATIDGQSDVSIYMTARGFFSIPAEATHQIQFSALGTTSGTPQFTVALAPAYQ